MPANPDETTLLIYYMAGLNRKGFPIIRQKKLSGVKASATDEELYELASDLFSLSLNPLVAVRRGSSDIYCSMIYSGYEY